MNQKKCAARMERIVPFYVMDLLARAKELEAGGRSIIHMEVGEPDFATVEPVIKAGKQALDDGYTGYTPATGIPQLKEAIADHYRQWFEIDVDPRRIIVTPGSSGALQLIMGVVVDPGREVLMTDPGYPCNKNFVEFFSGVPRPLPVGPESGYQLSAAQVADQWTELCCAALVASPSNPTGTLLSGDELAQILDVVRARNGTLIVDEIYQGLVYGADSYTALSLGDDLF
ncbi:MAG: aminotransferase class I/II-fold pyridoxal phosphate-dependent enzyme, partial [Desulfocapsaceae bacterium]|nr:aminotransferase class I/II-fold pyridoxal phosphate-dependent enzyme [Desulfocapsaceae bacterium]